MGMRPKKLDEHQELSLVCLEEAWGNYQRAKREMEFWRDRCVDLKVPKTQMAKVMGITEASIRLMYKRRSEKGPSLD